MAILSLLPFLSLLLFKLHFLSVKGIPRKFLLTRGWPGLWREECGRKLMVRSFLRVRREETQLLCLPLSLAHQEEHTDPPKARDEEAPADSPGSPGGEMERGSMSWGCLCLLETPNRAKHSLLKLLAVEI